VRAYRVRSLSALITGLAVLFGLASLIAAATREGDFGDRWMPALVVCALSVFCLTRLARSGVFVDDDGVKIVNPLRTDRIRWEDLHRFHLRPHKGFRALGFAQRLDGTEVQIWGIQARTSAPAAVRVPQGLIDELNERLGRERARRRAPEPPP